MSLSKKLTCKGNLRQVISVRGPLSSWVFVWGGLEILLVLNLKLLQNMFSNRTSYSPPPLPYTLHTYIQYTYSHREGGRGES
jgi:hypothetical protein